jgi:hypothetical protein
VLREPDGVRADEDVVLELQGEVLELGFVRELDVLSARHALPQAERGGDEAGVSGVDLVTD